MNNFNYKVNFVYEITKNYFHNNKSFFEHLLKTSNIIKNLFPNDQYLIDAGLFHSIYGTCYYEYNEKISRDEIQRLIGKKAENLVYIFCTLEDRTNQILKNKFDVDIQRDLYILEYANYVEQNGDEEIIKKIKKNLLSQFSIEIMDESKNKLILNYK